MLLAQRRIAWCTDDEWNVRVSERDLLSTESAFAILHRVTHAIGICGAAQCEDSMRHCKWDTSQFRRQMHFDANIFGIVNSRIFWLSSYPSP